MRKALSLGILFLTGMLAACGGGSTGSAPPAAADSLHRAAPNAAPLLYVANRGEDTGSGLGAVLEFR
jgi:hypothetical protein